FDIPLVLSTEPSGINDAGQIVGRYQDSGGVHSFLFSGGTFTALNDPSATGPTFAYGINNSVQIVGNYDNNKLDEPGFLYDPTSNIVPPPTSTCMIPWPTKAPMHAPSTTRVRSSAITPT